MRKTTGNMRGAPPDRSGSISVEMAIITPLLVFILFAIVELGWLMKDDMILGSACREACRKASLGRPVAEIEACAASAASELVTSALGIELKYLDSSSNTWVTLADTSEGHNTAPVGSEIRVTLTYTHRLMCGPVTALLADPGQTYRTLHCTMIALRN